MTRRHLLYALMVGATLPLSGCFLQLTVGSVGVENLSEQHDRYFAALEADATTATCRPNEFGSGVVCLYTFSTGDGFTQTESTVNLINEFGLFGVLIDPLVLELPQEATGITGTYEDDQGNSGQLIVYPGLSHVPADDDETISAAPGRQLVIVQLPDGVPIEGVDYHYSLNFEGQVPAGTAGPLPIRALLTGMVPTGSPGTPNYKVYYPPLAPCTSDISATSPITLPVAASPQALFLPFPTLCNNQTYTFFAIPRACDLDNDRDVDRNDLGLILAWRNRSVAPGDPRDISGDGRVDANDARRCTLQCTQPRCAT